MFRRDISILRLKDTTFCRYAVHIATTIIIFFISAAG